jgi:hypothetical protein
VAALVVIEGLAVGMLTLLVAGLLRSHAQMLARLAALEAAAAPASPPAPAPTPVDAPRRLRGATSTAIVGVTPDDEAVHLAVGGARVTTLLAFLSSGCSTCSKLWQALAEDEVPLPDRTRLVVVTLGPGEESPARVRRLAPAGVSVVMSSEAWQDYGVPGAPYFVAVDGPTGRLLGEGSARTWQEVRSLMGDAVADGLGPGGVLGAHRRREQRVDDELAQAGLRPGDPRLHHHPADRA